MTGHVHGHDHDHGPLEAITHVHGGAMVLDIGGSVGALHVLLGDSWAGHEVFLATVDPAFSTHTGVWRRDTAGGHVTSALFGALEAGTYRVLGRGGEDLLTVEVRGGELTEVAPGALTASDPSAATGNGGLSTPSQGRRSQGARTTE